MSHQANQLRTRVSDAFYGRDAMWSAEHPVTSFPKLLSSLPCMTVVLDIPCALRSVLFVTVSEKCVLRGRLNFYVVVMPRRVFLAKSFSGFHPVLSGSSVFLRPC